MRLLKPGVKTTGMNIQHPTEQANRPATGVVTDKGVPQSDSFAKYAAVDSICQCNTLSIISFGVLNFSVFLGLLFS
jgi:transposase